MRAGITQPPAPPLPRFGGASFLEPIAGRSFPWSPRLCRRTIPTAVNSIRQRFVRTITLLDARRGLDKLGEVRWHARR
jgi:hypothetical protein